VIPLLLFLIACATIYVGTIEAAFGALMRLSLRISAERSGRPGALAAYLDEPVLLFIPLRLLLAVLTASATALLAAAIGVNGPHKLVLVILSIAGFVIVCEQLLPFLITRRDPERVLEVLLPTFTPIAKALGPVSRLTVRTPARRAASGPAPVAENGDEAAEVTTAYGSDTEPEGLIEGEERRLLQSIVDFGDTLVREVMTPRPDLVAIKADATVGELRALFREQEYSRFPVFKDNLDNILGFVFVKDLVAVDVSDDRGSITPFLRPAVFVPESKRVSELLKQFQRQQTQIAIVVDEYGGTAGLVTIEDMLEEIVGEIRDEYDVESEPIIEEGEGRYVFNGKVDIDEVNQRLGVHIQREGFETVGGYLLTHLGRVPAVGEQFDMDGLRVDVLDVERRRIHRVRFTRQPAADQAEAEKETGVATRAR
jgi:CBS domain containing-hemolysin-like protein